MTVPWIKVPVSITFAFILLSPLVLPLLRWNVAVDALLVTLKAKSPAAWTSEAVPSKKRVPKLCVDKFAHAKGNPLRTIDAPEKLPIVEMLIVNIIVTCLPTLV